MFAREVVEELIGGLRATGFHVIATLANTFDSFLIVLTLPFEILGQNVIKRVGSTPAAASREFLELRQTLRLNGHCIHDGCKQYPTSCFEKPPGLRGGELAAP